MVAPNLLYHGTENRTSVLFGFYNIICKILNTTPDVLLLEINRNEDDTLINKTIELLKLLDEHQLTYANNFVKWLYKKEL